MGDLRHTNELCRVLGDASRLRLLRVLARHALTVAELTEVVRLTQSRVSTHLGKLREAGLVIVTRDGASAFYSVDEDRMTPSTRSFYALAEEAQDPLLEEDAARAAELVAARDADTPWADAVAGQMERHYSPGRTWESAARGLVGLAELGDVLDIASGDGAMAELLSPLARSVTCLDRSARVVSAAERRLAHLPHVAFAEGDMHALPFEDARFDQVLLMHALPYSRRPAEVVAEAARVLRPRGRLLVLTLDAHTHAEAVAPFNHENHGHAPEALAGLLRDAGLHVRFCEITHRERRAPHFRVVTAYADRTRRDK